MPRLRGLLFDKDGTLIDFHAAWAAFLQDVTREVAGGAGPLCALLLEIGGYDAARGRFAGDSLMAAGSTADLAEAWLPHLEGWSFDALVALIDRRAEAEVARAAPALLPLAPLFERLRARGLALGIATSDSEAGARAFLEREGAAHLVDFVSGYDSGNGSKAGPGMALAFAEASGHPPESLGVVGDNVTDLLMGRSAGYGLRLGVLTGTGSAASLAVFARAVLPSIAELEAWLDENAAG